LSCKMLLRETALGIVSIFNFIASALDGHLPLQESACCKANPLEERRA
jgi:hypothetical protein